VVLHLLAALFNPVVGNVVWFLDSVILILVVLIQRGRGGGLAGALGGMGGHSAFGTRTGDVMTAVTVVAFAIWLMMAMVLVPAMSVQPKFTSDVPDVPAASAEESPEGRDAPTGPGSGENRSSPAPVPAGKSPDAVRESKDSTGSQSETKSDL
jgi:preprotein translocase subunit SecG